MKIRYLIILLYFLIYVPCTSHCQFLKVNKKIITNIFNENAKGVTFNWKKRNWDISSNIDHLNDFNRWYSCKIDSLNNGDTIVFYNYLYYYTKVKNCGMISGWIINHKKKITPYGSDGYKSWTYPSESYKIVNKRKSIKIIFYNKEKVTSIYNIISLRLLHIEKDSLYVMKLVEEKSN